MRNPFDRAVSQYKFLVKKMHARPECEEMVRRFRKRAGVQRVRRAAAGHVVHPERQASSSAHAAACMQLLLLRLRRSCMWRCMEQAAAVDLL